MLNKYFLSRGCSALHAIEYNHICSCLNCKLDIIIRTTCSNFDINRFFPVCDLADFGNFDGQIIWSSPVWMSAGASLIDAEPTALGISTELSSGDDEQELTDFIELGDAAANGQRNEAFLRKQAHDALEMGKRVNDDYAEPFMVRNSTAYHNQTNALLGSYIKAAEKELDDSFTEMGFHTAILKSGSVPYFIVERNVNAWIEEVKANPGSSAAESEPESEPAKAA